MATKKRSTLMRLGGAKHARRAKDRLFAQGWRDLDCHDDGDWRGRAKQVELKAGVGATLGAKVPFPCYCMSRSDLYSLSMSPTYLPLSRSLSLSLPL